MPLGVQVLSGETAQSGGVSTSTGTAFIVAPSTYGPETPTLVRSLNEVVALYAPEGRETGNTLLYDAANAFFAFEGQKAYINRAGEGEGSPLAALKKLETTSKTEVITVTAKYKGAYGNKIKIEVAEAGGKTKLVIFAPNGEVLQESGEYTEAKELLKWGEEEAHKAYVVLTEGANYATGKTELVKKVASAALTTGANPETKEKGTIKAIEGFPKNLGPGTLICPENSETTTKSETEKVHTAMGEHALKNNRFAVCDLFEVATKGVTAATLITNKGTIATSLKSYMAFFNTAVTAGGTTSTPTVSRTIAPSGVVAGLFAQVSRQGNNNRAPAGRFWPLAPFVTGLLNTYTEANQEKLNNEGINNIVERFGVISLYGDRTAISPESDPIYFQYSAARERMQLVVEAEEIGERFLFATLDGRHQKRAKFAGELQALIKKHWEAGALYGENVLEAGIVNVGEPVNTPTSEAAGELKAEMICRLSPVAEFVKITIIAKSIVEPV